ncbi:MAG: gluconokinase [Micrococcaceae bacterium]
MKHIIGLDIGTTSTKAVLFDESGKILETANEGYPLYEDEVDMAEQDPQEILEAVIEVLYKLVYKSEIEAKSIRGVSISAAMHSLILVDDDMQPLTRSITWADNRAAKYSAELKQTEIGQQIYEKTGTPIHPMAPLSKLIWLRNEKPKLFAKTKYFIGIKEYILYRLFGELKTDYSIASTTGLFNIFDLTWDAQALETAGIATEQLPEPVPITYQMRGLKPQYVEETGLSASITFVMGGSDGALSNLGVNAVSQGTLALTIGTSGAVRTVVNKPVTDPKGRLFCYVLDEGRWLVGGPVNNGGIIFNWVKEQIFNDEISFEELNKIITEIPAGAEGLLFLPYLGGERAPLWDADARGTFFGMTRTHNRNHLARAALEGINFNLNNVVKALEETTGEVKTIQATGGFARSELWKQMLADIFDKDINIPESFESSCLGAAVIAMKSLNMIDDLDEVHKMLGVTDSYKPNPENVAKYQKLFKIYTNLDGVLKDEYSVIADYQRQNQEGK